MVEINDCPRCGNGMSVIMSYFTREMICLGCIQKEKDHPRFAEAELTEREAAGRGEIFTFQGIGKPDDL